MTEPVDLAIARIARKHGGHVSRAELGALGLSADAIKHRVARGLLIPVYQGVYAVGHLPTSPIDRAAGALLACGPRSALSHGSAAMLWDISRRWSYPLELTSPLNRHPRGLTVRRTAKLIRTDVRTRLGLRVVSPALTIVQIAPRLSEKRLIRALNELRLERRLALEELEAVLERFPRHPGARRLRPLLDGAQPEPTRSAFEDEWPPFAVAHKLGRYEMNVVVCGYRVDVRFGPDLLIVELDGWGTHGQKPAFEADREQDAEILTRTGIPTLRITYDQFHAHPARQAARILRILADRLTRAAA